ncbi:MAG: hypothetical protein CVV33_01305, partial [Methanomicrobiales archaeon HGW-Methanomicrobiales-4]
MERKNQPHEGRKINVASPEKTNHPLYCNYRPGPDEKGPCTECNKPNHRGSPYQGGKRDCQIICSSCFG